LGILHRATSKFNRDPVEIGANCATTKTDKITNSLALIRFLCHNHSMDCPRCHYPDYTSFKVCPRCGFQSQPALFAELKRLDWLLAEMETWRDLPLPPEASHTLRTHYTALRQKLETELGLRYPPFTAEEAQAAWPQYLRLETLFQASEEWLSRGILKTGHLPREYARLLELRQRLEGQVRPEYPQNDAERLEVVEFLLQGLQTFRFLGDFKQTGDVTKLSAPLLAKKATLEARLQPQPVLSSVEGPVLSNSEGPASVLPVTPASRPIPEPAPRPPAPRQPLGETLWRTILSERTLHALLFLGIFLLFTAAISFVIWGWKDFSAPIRVAIPSGFTALFFFLGWLVRTKTSLYRSGIALSAIAALFVPIDCYTVYANYGSPPQGWPDFWLGTSLVCLLAYTLSALSIQSRFFGYLTAVALGSVLLAVLEKFFQPLGLARDWYYAALTLLAAALNLAALSLERMKSPGRWRCFAEPFRFLALLTPALLMPLTLALRLLTRESYDALHYAMTVIWFTGGGLFGWGAIRHRSRGLGNLAALALPVAVYMLQSALFFQTGANPAWHAFGLACLTPLYLLTGYKLQQAANPQIPPITQSPNHPILLAHSQTALRWGVALIGLSALLPLTDLASGAAAAASHAVLLGSAALAAWLWRQPRYVYAASLFAFTASSFAMSELKLPLEQLSVGWVSLALAHLLLALAFDRDRTRRFIAPLIPAAYLIAGLAALLPVLFDKKPLLIYTLGNWLVMSAWGARLAWKKQPGFAPGEARRTLPAREAPGDANSSLTVSPAPAGATHFLSGGALFHWMTAIPLPFWLFVVFTRNQPAGLDFPLALAALGWGLVFVNHWLRFLPKGCRLPWRLAGLAVSVSAPLIASLLDGRGYAVSITLLAAGLLYFADTLASRQRWEFYPAGLVTAWGLLHWLNIAEVDSEFLALALCGLVTVYLLAGLLAERYRWAKSAFLAPLYHTAHLLTFGALDYILLIWLLSLSSATDRFQLVSGLALLLLAGAYGLFAWGRRQERWAFLAVWLAAGGGGLIILVYSTGQGSLAAKGALIVVALVLAERLLHALKHSPGLPRRRLAFLRLLWGLFHRPLLVTGWTGSAAIIVLALVRNLILLGGGRVAQTWAAVGLLIITALYALSARLFRQARFVWLSGGLIFLPWTILTNLGWFTAWVPTWPDFAISWLALAWSLLGLNLLVKRYAPPAYARPLSVYAQLLTPLALLWGVADTGASRFSFGLAVAFYGFSAWLQHRRTVQDETVPSFTATRFLYPALALIPVWCVYLLKNGLPPARHEHFGLLLLSFGIWGLLAGRGLEKLAPRPPLARPYGLPAYLTGYATLIVGTLLTAHLPVLLALALLYAALLLVISAWIFRSALWIYPATGLAALAWLIALAQAEIPVERRGWGLLGLAALYLALGWTLRRARLPAYGGATLAAGFAVIALSLPPSSLDQTGALWGYGGAALLYAVCAFWLGQPLLLVLACALAPVTYASGLRLSSVPPAEYGMLLFPGALLAFGLGWLADLRRGAWRDFPFYEPLKWPLALAERLANWWGLPLYALGLGLASFAPLFTGHQPARTALNCLLLMFFYALAAYRFRSRFWLGTAALAGHLAAAYYLHSLGWWLYPEQAWLRFLPVTLLTAAAALGLEKWLHEGSPLEPERWFKGWSRPLYFFVLIDLLLGQAISLGRPASETGMLITLTHALLLAALATLWLSNWLPYISTALGLLTMIQWQRAIEGDSRLLPVFLAELALGYGALGFGYTLLKRRPRPRSGESDPPPAKWASIWEAPLQRSGMLVSFLALFLMVESGFRLGIWTVRALFGLSFREIVDLQTVWMVVKVFSLVGLHYATAAAAYRRMRLGYLAVGLLLVSWFLFAFYINTWGGLRQVQTYALPAGLYLLAIGYLEWRNGQRRLARWLDYLAMLLMLGSLFWQTLEFGLLFAFLLICEGAAALWWGSARRLRRFFYAGIIGVMLAALGQLVNALQSINQWLVFGLIGLTLVALAVLVERKLETIKAWREILETWE
jgi:hypothetical protein